MTFTTAQRTPFFRNERWAVFFLNILQRYRSEFQLHDFVIMHDHIHLLMTPTAALERSAQLLKGGFSFSAKREFTWRKDIWQQGFSDHRIRDFADWQHHIAYIQKNIDSLRAENYRFCGLNAGLPLYAIPQWLKPLDQGSMGGGAEAPPFQSDIAEGTEQTTPGDVAPESILMDWK